MNNINKILALLLTIFFSIWIVNADNKSDLLSSITTLQTKLNTLKTTKTTDLDTKVSELTNKFNNLFTTWWIDTKTIDYLVSLWKINSNFKTDLVTELWTVKTDLNSKIALEVNTLDSLKDTINFTYTTVSDSDKTKLNSTITSVETNYKNLDDTFSARITQLNNKYSTTLDSYKASVTSAYNSNKSSIDSIKSFDVKYNELYSLKAEFDKYYEVFQKAYLTYAWDLKDYSNIKQKEYVASLKKELEKLRDWNLNANPSLKTYEADINRLIDLLLENFENSLSAKINESYWVIYSDSDVSSLVSRFDNLKNKYYDIDWNIKWKEVISWTWWIDEISYLKWKLAEVNSSLKNVVWADTVSTVTLSNIKVRLENVMVKFYNDNYNSYRNDLLAKLKEKLDLSSLEAKNTILAADSIDLRFSLLNDKISKSNDLTYIKSQISDFKWDVAKYSYLNSTTLNKKISKLNNNLDIFTINKEISATKYSKYSSIWKSYDTQLNAILPKLKTKFPDTYETKLNKVVSKIDTLTEKKLNDKTRYSLLSIKKAILTWLNNQ